ncbi:response regulator [Belliella kenyensis]|uniref:Response regulator n=1 Tax=Belliella kenyensis TaxID=1472724 RepID=A0ABV8ENB7_9BACT|nr:response regulator [Belliella kenyensis]MCH7402948.1 response regulator [Belliella kenyensis]MDN3604984.1 response regulator [Belliella kenyensis]
MKHKKVLIVEDNALNRKLFEHIMGQEYDVQFAKNGLEAIESLRNNHFDLILLDIQMPIMDGISTLSIIKSEQLTTSPIIATSAFANQADKDYFTSTGFSDFIAKPIKPRSFLEVISNYLNRDDTNSRDRVAKELDQYEILDLKVIDQLLKYNSIENIQLVYNEFFEETNSLLEEIEILIKNEDFPLIGDKLHIIKGNSGTLGAKKIFNCSKQFENDIKNSIFDHALEDYHLLKEQFESFKLHVNNHNILTHGGK